LRHTLASWGKRPGQFALALAQKYDRPEVIPGSGRPWVIATAQTRRQLSLGTRDFAGEVRIEQEVCQLG